MITLHRRAPWNRSLTGYRYYVQSGDRKFTVSSLAVGIYSTCEVDETGLPIGWKDNPRLAAETKSLGIAYTTAQVRMSIEMWLAGKTADEICVAVATAPRVGRGRNAPKKTTTHATAH